MPAMNASGVTPAFSAASRKYQDKGVQFVGLSIDTPTNVRDFQLEHRVSYPLLLAEPSVVQLTEGLGNAARTCPDYSEYA